MQLSEKDKQALQEKYKAQRQAMWSGKQSMSQDSAEKTAEESDDQTASVESSGDTADNTTGSTDTTPSDSQSDPSSVAADQPSSTGTADEETSQGESSVQSESGSKEHAPASSSVQNVGDGEKTSQSPAGTEASVLLAEANPTAENTGEQKEEEEQARKGERVFWEAAQEGGPSVLTWKLVLGVIGVAIVLVGVGIMLGYLFAS